MIKQSIIQKPLLPLLLSLFLGATFSQAASAQENFQKVVGSAYSVKTGALVYRETHTVSADGKHNVEYSEPDGLVFGNKVIDESQSKIAPSFTQTNMRNGEEIEVDSSAKKIVVHYKKDRKTERKVADIDYQPGMVVDAGFNAFVKQYWQSLENDTKMDIQFVVPSRQSTVDFTVSRSLCKPDTQKGAECFVLTPDSWVVKMLVDPILLAYDSDTKRLLRFTGRANIADENGDYQAVDIQYHYY